MKLFITLACLLAAASALPFEGRITNGEFAKPGQFPYQVGLSLHIGKQRAFCGGSIISDEWILTAAHCADVVDGVDVYIGTIDITSKDKQEIYVAKDNIFVHEKWDAQTIKNDIALIRLPKKLRFDDHVRAIALPKKSNKYSTYEGELAIASGWGKIKDSATSVTDKLEYIEAPILANAPCSKYYLGNVNDNNICISTKGTKKSTCNGDSGGPLALHEDKKEPVLIGATSFGIALGCEKGFPGVFTRITSYLDWIESKTGPL